jgi:hypothetical protein
MTSIATGRLRQGTTASAAVKVACIAATTANITLEGEQTIDGIALVEDDRCLVKDQTDGTENGIYNVATGAWVRAADFDGRHDVVEGTIIPVSRGTVSADTEFRVSNTGSITIDTTSITFEARGSSDSSAVTYVPSGTGAVNTTVQARLREFITTADFGVVADESTDNTAKVQEALDYANGRIVYNPDGAYFDLSALTFPNNIDANTGYYVLEYRANDDTSSPGQPATHTTNERVRFLHNNNPSGYNNEIIFLSGYSTGWAVNCRRDLDTPNIGAGQIIEYGRVSATWQQDDRTRAQFKYTDSAGDTSSPGLDDGFTLQFIESRQTLGNIKQSSFSATLVVNDMIKGTTSGARGWVKSIGASDVIITWLSGTFAVGETVILEPAQETTTDTISTVSALSNTSRSNRIGWSMKQIGNMFTNIQGDDAIYPFVCGGIIGIQQANTTNGSFTNGELYLSDDFGNETQSVRLQLEAATGDAVLLVNGTEYARVTEEGFMDISGSIRSDVGMAPGIITSASLEDISHAINITNKTTGLCVYNVTTNKPVWSDGTTAGAVWVDATGSTAHTPV